MLALDRNEAKQVFQTKEPAPLGALIEELWNDVTRTADRKLDYGIEPYLYVELVQKAETLDDTAKSLLTRGGRQLPSDERSEVYLLRPDLIAPLSLAVSTFLNRLATFLSQAASNGEAILIIF